MAKPLPILPVSDHLDALQAALADKGNAVLVAPPGAGKTTIVPLALLDAPWRGDGMIVLLEPRRIAARAAARRMAELLGEEVGQTIGYRMRLDSKVSAKSGSSAMASVRSVSAASCRSRRTLIWPRN